MLPIREPGISCAVIQTERSKVIRLPGLRLLTPAPLGRTADLPESFVPEPPTQTVGYGAGKRSRYIFRDNAEFPMMTASEIQFLKAGPDPER